MSNARLAGRYYVQQNIPGTLAITVLNQDGYAVDLSGATDIRVYLASDSVDWTNFDNFTAYSSLDASSRVTVAGAAEGLVNFTYEPAIWADAGEYKMGVRVYTAAAPSGSIYPEFAWDTLTVFSNYSKTIQKMIDRFRTFMMMWTARYETVHASTNNLMDFELYACLEEGVSFFNGYPPYPSTYTLTQITTDTNFEGIVFLCALIFAILSMELFEIGKHFQYNDNGLSLVRDKSGKYAGLIGQITAMIQQQLPILKKQLGLDSIHLRGQFSGMTGMPRSWERALRGTRAYR